MKKKILIYSSSRADIDRYVPIIKKILKENIFEPILFLSSFHKKKDSKKKLYEIQKLKIKLIQNNLKNKLNDNYISTIEHFSSDLKKFNKTLLKFRPKIVFILGDRFEITSASIPSVLQDITIVHLYGGSVTEGALDEKIRHAVTKLSNIHLVLNKKYSKRVSQLGEEPWRIKIVGLEFLNELKNQKIMSKKTLFKKFNFNTKIKTFFATYHPVTLEKDNHKYQIKNFLNAINKSKYQCIFTYPNFDSGYKLIINEIKKLTRSNKRKYIFLKKLDLLEYTSVLKHCDAIIGNSSLGIVDSASFEKPVINIGNRQKGKIFSKNIIQSKNNSSDIIKSINFLETKKFRKRLRNLKNSYEPQKYNLSKFLNSLLTSKKYNISKKKFIDIIK